MLHPCSCTSPVSFSFLGSIPEAAIPGDDVELDLKFRRKRARSQNLVPKCWCEEEASGRSWSSMWSPISSGFPLDCSKILQLPQHHNSVIPFLFAMHQWKFSSWKSKVCHSQVAGNNYNSQLFAAWKSNRKKLQSLVLDVCLHNPFPVWNFMANFWCKGAWKGFILSCGIESNSQGVPAPAGQNPRTLNFSYN